MRFTRPSCPRGTEAEAARAWVPPAVKRRHVGSMSSPVGIFKGRDACPLGFLEVWGIQTRRSEHGFQQAPDVLFIYIIAKPIYFIQPSPLAVFIFPPDEQGPRSPWPSEDALHMYPPWEPFKAHNKPAYDDCQYPCSVIYEAVPLSSLEAPTQRQASLGSSYVWSGEQ
ncbi:hypothetical protein NDU88_006776 [Pleurodeles waltl]|uniref:Uncharacterized protein n=1 Tax=Pleurodeles waltl TaxID=8319 RepID=A0AAV7SQG0_PLEWA|nr:hypothetical protein NDU88_006776 [Pleurodeles waltl]